MPAPKLVITMFPEIHELAYDEDEPITGKDLDSHFDDWHIRGYKAYRENGEPIGRDDPIDIGETIQVIVDPAGIQDYSNGRFG